LEAVENSVNAVATGWRSERRKAFTLDAGTTGQLGGWNIGGAAPVLELHEGPGLSFNYLEELIGRYRQRLRGGDLPAMRPGPVVNQL
jgi:hypothetical protein